MHTRNLPVLTVAASQGRSRRGRDLWMALRIGCIEEIAMFTQGFGSRRVVLTAILTGMGLMGVARPAQAQCQPQELAIS